MQKVKKVTGILVIILFYCISAGFVNTNYGNAVFVDLTKAERDFYSSLALVDLRCHTVPGKNQVKNINYLTAKVIRIVFCKLSAIYEHIRCVIGRRFCRNILYSMDFLIQRKKTNILFPFHNFW
ncbi:MAG: hypothetical protein PHR81_12745 [Bacteroidales bacterium]|nr:hypothetical protein [Bacteroidales bacterium]